MTKEMTVEQAILGLLISYLERGIRRVPIWEVEQAHPQHRLSGRARIRGLRQKGLVKYRYCGKDNTYEIFSTLQELYTAVNRLTGQVVFNPTRTTKKKEEYVDVEDIKSFIQKLEMR